MGTSLASDPPLHTQLRLALTENLTPRALCGMKDSIDQKAVRIVRELVAKGSFDGAQDPLPELPLQVMVDLIGIKVAYVRSHIPEWGPA